MPSPFPGMDPYLEDHTLWPDVHSSLISYIREDLQPQVRPKYIARITERIELNELNKGYIPDVRIVQPPHNLAPTISGGVLVADSPQTFAFLEEERHVPSIEIVYRATGDVVTVIEVLSPANKVGEGRARYLQKQADLLTSQVNLVEIDLLSNEPTPTLARTVPIMQPPNWRYVVSVNRAHQRHLVEIYSFALKDRMPRCRIPLRPADADVVLDLPTVFTRCYDVGGYDLLIDYSQKPPIDLRQAEAEWLQQHIKIPT